MVIARAVWFVISLPFRLIFWLAWQARRAGIAIAAALQRTIGQRNTMLALAVVMALFGLGLVSGFVDCSPRRRFDGCFDGLEVPQGGSLAEQVAYALRRDDRGWKASQSMRFFTRRGSSRTRALTR